MPKLVLLAVVSLVVLGLVGPASAGPAGSGGSSGSQTIQVTVPSNRAHTNDGTVLPPHGEVGPPEDGDGHGGLLPDTGGPAFWLLVSGAAAALVGAGVVRRNRRGRPSAG